MQRHGADEQCGDERLIPSQLVGGDAWIARHPRGREASAADRRPRGGTVSHTRSVVSATWDVTACCRRVAPGDDITRGTQTRTTTVQSVPSSRPTFTWFEGSITRLNPVRDPRADVPRPFSYASLAAYTVIFCVTFCRYCSTYGSPWPTLDFRKDFRGARHCSRFMALCVRFQVPFASMYLWNRGCINDCT